MVERVRACCCDPSALLSGEIVLKERAYLSQTCSQVSVAKLGMSFDRPRSAQKIRVVSRCPVPASKGGPLCNFATKLRCRTMPRRHVALQTDPIRRCAARAAAHHYVQPQVGSPTQRILRRAGDRTHVSRPCNVAFYCMVRDFTPLRQWMYWRRNPRP